MNKTDFRLCRPVEKGKTMYKSPIDLIYEDMSAHMANIAKKVDEDIWQAVVRYVPNIDKNELIRALQYDRDQYEKGYADGKRDAMAELVRCKDCKHCKNLFCYHPLQKYLGVYPEHFCSHGETIK